MSDFTPTTEQVRKAYAHAYAPQQFFGRVADADRAGHGDEFDRWLAAHDAELREQIAAEIEAQMTEDVRTRDRLSSDWLAAGQQAAYGHAARIARGEKPS